MGDFVAVTYLPSNPSTNRVGQPFEMAVPRALTLWPFVAAVVLFGLGCYRSIK